MIKKPELRKDYIQDRYVIIAPRRSKRPHDTEKPMSTNQQKPIEVFTPKKLRHEKALLTIGPESSWRIKVLKNKFPAVDPSFPKAYGYQEVVVETPDPDLELEDLSIMHIAELIEAYATRTNAISEDPRIEYILIYKNNGGRAGQSLQHAHSQIFATEFLPPNLFDKSQKTQEYRIKTGRCVYCDVIKKEKKGPRLVYNDKHVIAFCPYASQHNYEIWILPHRHLDNVTQLHHNDRVAIAKILQRVLKKIGALNLPYNYYFHQVINDHDQHLYMKIVPRGSVWAGVEIGSGVIINPIAPEDAAKYYRT